MAIPSLPFLVTTRIIAGLHRGHPALRRRAAVVVLRDPADRHPATSGSRTGTYDHYFNLFLPPGDVLWSFGKVLVFAVVVILIHCYYGYNATGGPAGVGVAVGRRCAPRSSPSTSSTSSCRWRSGAPRPPSGSRGERVPMQASARAAASSAAACCRAYGVSSSLVARAAASACAIAVVPEGVHDVVTVTLQTDRVGNQLQEAADVKLRGLIVGEVRQVERRRPTGATHRAGASARTSSAQIPANVTRPAAAQDAVRRAVRRPASPPARPRARLIRAATSSRRTAAGVAIELEKVLDDLLPAAAHGPAGQARRHPQRARRPRSRAAATQLGHNLVLVDRYLKALNPSMPDDPDRTSPLLADTADLYAGVAPDFFRLTESLRGHQQDHRREEPAARGLPRRHRRVRQRRGRLPARQRAAHHPGRPGQQADPRSCSPSTRPIYPCVASGLVNWLPRANAAFAGGTFHITLEVVPPRQPYRPGEEPRWDDKRGPHCYGLPTPGGSQSNPFAGNHFDDGTQPASNAPALLRRAAGAARQRLRRRTPAAPARPTSSASSAPCSPATASRPTRTRAASRPCSPVR